MAAWVTTRSLIVARRIGLADVGFGYWIEGSKKMSYKTRFTPQEHLGPNGWVRG